MTTEAKPTAKAEAESSPAAGSVRRASTKSPKKGAEVSLRYIASTMSPKQGAEVSLRYMAPGPNRLNATARVLEVHDDGALDLQVVKGRHGTLQLRRVKPIDPEDPREARACPRWWIDKPAPAKKSPANA